MHLFLSMRLEHCCEAHSLKVISFLISKFLFFQTHCRVLPVWVWEPWKAQKLVTLEGWIILPVKSHWTMNISADFCRTAKSFWWLENTLLRSSLNPPSLIAAEQYAYCSGQINFWSHLGEIRPQKSRKFHRTPSRCRIESIKSEGERSQKVTLITCPRHFLETPISCRIYVPKNAFLQVNPLGTSLKVLLILTFCYLCRLPGHFSDNAPSNKICRRAPLVWP